jgi:hypothetical protein
VPLNFQSFRVSTKTFKTRFRLCITKNKIGKRFAGYPKTNNRTKIEKLHQQNFDALADKIYCFQNEKNTIEQFVLRFRDCNTKYLEIKSIVEEQGNRLLTEQAGLLTSALIAVVEASRLNPDRYAVIYDNK